MCTTLSLFLQINAAGQKFLDLIHTEWKTYNNHVLSKGSAFTVRGFRGDYVVRVKVNGQTVNTQYFSLGKDDHNINLHVSAHG